MRKVYLWYPFMTRLLSQTSESMSSETWVGLILSWNQSEINTHLISFYEWPKYANLPVFLKVWNFFWHGKRIFLPSIFLHCVEKDNNLGPLNFKPISKTKPQGMMMMVLYSTVAEFQSAKNLYLNSPSLTAFVISIITIPNCGYYPLHIQLMAWSSPSIFNLQNIWKTWRKNM